MSSSSAPAAGSVTVFICRFRGKRRPKLEDLPIYSFLEWVNILPIILFKIKEGIVMKESNLEERHLVNTAAGFFLLIIIGIIISAIRLNFYI